MRPIAHPRLTLLTLLPLLAGCHLFPQTSDQAQEPTEEEQLELYTTTATYLYDDGSLDRAQSQALKALEIDPSHRGMRRLIGWIRIRKGSTEDLLIARDLFDELYAQGDENEATALGLATSLERLGLAWGEAARRVAAGEQAPSAGRSVESDVQRLERRSRDLLERSYATYSGALNDGEGSTDVMNGLQRASALLGRYEESLEWSARLLERAQEEIELWDQLLQRKNLSEKEERLYREERRIAMQLQLDTHLFAATLLHDRGELEEAIGHLDAVVQANPELPQGYSLRAQLLAGRGDYDEAIADLDRFLGLSEQPFEHPEIARAFELRTECEMARDRERR